MGLEDAALVPFSLSSTQIWNISCHILVHTFKISSITYSQSGSWNASNITNWVYITMYRYPRVDYSFNSLSVQSIQRKWLQLLFTVFLENSWGWDGEPEDWGSHVHPGEETADSGPRRGLEDHRPRSRQRLHPVHCGCTYGEERLEGILNTHTVSVILCLHLLEAYALTLKCIQSFHHREVIP